jgi:hypothetical protein
MDKLFIQQMLRESLEAKLQEAEKDDKEGESGDKSWEEMNKDERKEVQSLTKKIHNATQGKGKLLKLSQVGGAAGVIDPKDAIGRSALGKAVSGKPDADGNVRHLTKKDAASMGKVVDNPVAYK